MTEIITLTSASAQSERWRKGVGLIEEVHKSIGQFNLESRFQYLSIFLTKWNYSLSCPYQV